MTQQVTDGRKKITSIARECEEAAKLTEMTITSRHCCFKRFSIGCLLHKTAFWGGISIGLLCGNISYPEVLSGRTQHARVLTSNRVFYEVMGRLCARLPLQISVTAYAYVYHCRTSLGGFVLKYCISRFDQFVKFNTKVNNIFPFHF
jgi:hypothetical protein